MKHRPVGRMAARAAMTLFRADNGYSQGILRKIAGHILAREILRSGLFDAYSYSSETGVRGLSEEALVNHYLGRPGEAGSSPQPRFDAERYRRLAGLAPRVVPFLHFATKADRSDGLADGFDAKAYLAANPDVRLGRWDPTQHFIERGWREGRVAPAGPPPPLPDFTGLPGRASAVVGADGARVDVLVPVYGGRAETLTALHSVLSARSATSYRLVVVDDASPEGELVGDLIGLEERGLIFRLINPRNLGFTATANRGFALSRDRDVVLLNSDAEVYDDWLDHLRRHAYGSADIATVTPISNSATILSYPVRLRDNPAPLELAYSDLAALVGAMAQSPVEIPTGVGFCMYVRRDCLEAIGGFDEVAFPRGYGEENDFCLRARAAGWRHLAATDTFVRHLGARSFGNEKQSLIAKGLMALEARHPGYLALIDRFIAKDPLEPVRVALDVARIKRAGHSGRLFHSVRTNAGREGDLRLRRMAGYRDRFLFHAPRVPNTPNLADLDPTLDAGKTMKFLSDIGVSNILVEDAALFGRKAVTSLRSIAEEAAIDFRVY